MTVRELVDKLSKMDQDAEIITYNMTSHRWFKTGSSENYPVKTIAETIPNCGDYAKKQLSNFKENDVTFFF